MYEAFYKLTDKPFRLTPDAAMLFPSKSHQRAMSYLLYGFEQGEGFVMITGAVGTGKTLLIQKLMEELAQRNIAIASIASANLDGEDILPAVAAEFGLPYDGRSKEALLQDVKQHLITLHTHATQALLVMDEAQTLTAEALEMLRILSNFEVKGRALLQVFLVGQVELRNVMVSNHLEQLRQRIIASYRLEPLELEECREYIQFRLRAVGWNDDPDLDPTLFAAVHKASRGIPRKINLIMDRLLLSGYLEGQHHLDAASLKVVLDEMHEEMAGVPQTLEPAALDLPAPSPSPRRAKREPSPAMAPKREPSPAPATRREPSPASAPGHPPAPDPTSPPPAHQREIAALELELKYNSMLLRLMREEVRLKHTLSTDALDAPLDEDAVLSEILALNAGLKNEP